MKTNLKNSQNVTAEMNNFAKEAKIKFRYLFLWDPSYLRIREWYWDAVLDESSSLQNRQKLQYNKKFMDSGCQMKLVCYLCN